MSATVYFNVAMQALQRNNPVLQVMASIQQALALIMNYKSNLRLNKYRQSLYMQQLRRMEGFITEGSPYQHRGVKMDRKF